MNHFIRNMAAATVFAASSTVHAGSVGIGQGSWYSPTLADTLAAQGNTVGAVTWYNDNVLAGYDVFIQDGNAWFDADALDRFVYNGGTLIALPWSFTQKSYSAGTSVFGSRHGLAINEAVPGITTLAATDWLLQGVTLPAAESHNVSREAGNAFADMSTQVLAWEDGTALLGYRRYGAGLVVGFNVNLTSADVGPLDAAWSNQIVFNAVNAVPEPATWAMLALGAGIVALRAHRGTPKKFA